MRIFDETKDICLKNTAVTLGKFNAMHLGHQSLISEIKKEKGLEITLFSFDTAKIMNQPVVMTKEERIEICSKLGMDNVIFYPVNEETMSIEPENFIKDILINQLDSKVIVTGKDFRFGKNRRGDISLLEKYSNEYGYQLKVVDSVTDGDVKVSSTDIKQYLKEGNIEKANEMLGYRYFIMGEVIKGRQLGRTIDTRTINVSVDDNKIVPLKGVYKTNVVVESKRFLSITNIGINPTVGYDNNIKVETHILDFDGNLYGKKVKIEFIKFIRNEHKFSSMEELKRQILLDISVAKN